MKIRNRVIAFVVSAVAAGIALHAVPANASTHKTTPAARTCAAFRTWDHHRTTANLDALLTASETAPWVPLGADVVVVYTDVRGHDTYDLAADVKAIGQDCHR